MLFRSQNLTLQRGPQRLLEGAELTLHPGHKVGLVGANGAGKTTLVMAAMWALTGNSDLRVEGGAGKTLTKTDVVNDYAKTARVRLEGAANGVPFWVERRVSRSKLLGLRYGVGDEERTLADSRLTQAAMDADLGASVAARIAFHGQHTVGQLLDANDAALKAALGELVDAATWQEAKDLSRKRVTAARKRAAALGADASARADYVRRIEQRLSAATAAARACPRPPRRPRESDPRGRRGRASPRGPPSPRLRL